jgi:hypothetical protein
MKLWRMIMDSKTKARNARLLRTYGITVDDYERMLAAQGGGCAICGRVPPAGKNWNIEHDHKSRLLRGVACPYCNLYLIGKYRDPDVLQKVVDYLRNPPAAQFGFAPVPAKKPLTRRKRRK